jgi:hypothetical protein
MSLIETEKSARGQAHSISWRKIRFSLCIRLRLGVRSRPIGTAIGPELMNGLSYITVIELAELLAGRRSITCITISLGFINHCA